MTTPTESTLRAALSKVVKTYDDYRRRGVAPAPAEYADVVEAIDAARAALAAHPARASQEPYPPLPVFAGMIGGVTASVPFVHWQVEGYTAKQMRAYVDADRAARPESVDARRYRWLRDGNNWTDEGLVVCSSGGEDTCYGEQLDKAIDAAIAEGAQDER